MGVLEPCRQEAANVRVVGRFGARRPRAVLLLWPSLIATDVFLEIGFAGGFSGL